MVRFRLTARQSGYFIPRIAICVLALSTFLAPILIHGRTAQGQSEAPGATLQGKVRDSHGDAIAAATVYLQLKTGTQILTILTDSDGAYRFSALSDGVYAVRAEMAGYSSTTFSPCVLEPRETKRVDLTLESTTVSARQSGSGTSGTDKPQFFDEPTFTVAGVTEAMNPGGHGSNAILRTTEALAKETASLGATAANEQPSSSRTASTSASSRAATEQSLRDAVAREPADFEANYRLGKLLADDGKPGEALPYLERASQLNPGDFEGAYELALASAAAGQYERARTQVRSLLNLDDKATQNKSAQQQADLHRLLGDIEEKVGNPLEAVREYQHAAELDPSEPNLFDWGADLLIHRAFEPAIEVFTKGNRLFPRSARMLAGQGVAWYARGAYDQAAQSLCEASDLNPDDPSFYLLLGKMQSVEAGKSECVAQSLRRFARLRPENALANYYYALSLWNLQGNATSAGVELLLEKTVQLDPNFGAGYLKLGILYSDRGDSTKALAAYQRAAAASPDLEEAHYRLAQAYNRAGEESEAQGELQLYQQLSKKREEEAQRERREIQQFVYTLREH
ncbi:MAG TPA: tetratricopeptide repeat protein [Terriglobales bacterium]|nr:tetratricopeptide repeat protein [Terriglobales bacterium]